MIYNTSQEKEHFNPRLTVSVINVVRFFANLHSDSELYNVYPLRSLHGSRELTPRTLLKRLGIDFFFEHKVKFRPIR